MTMEEEEAAREDNATLTKNTINNENENQHTKQGPNESSSSSSSSSSSTASPSSLAKVDKGKSCKGTLYYSSSLKSNAKNPFCVGFSRSLPHVPSYAREHEPKAANGSRNLTDFKYGCLGYSLYKDCKNQPNNATDSQNELPICVGLEVLVDRRPNSAESTAVIHNKEDGQVASQRQPQKPAPSFGDEFLGRFTRNANLVAMGVLKNMRRVGNQIKDTVDDILYPYRKRPK